MSHRVPGRNTVAEPAVTITHVVQHMEDAVVPAETDRAERRSQLVAWMAGEVETEVTDLFGNPALAEVPLPSRPQAARTARQLIRTVLGGQWCIADHVTDDAVLLGSELVANVVQHTGARVLGLRMRQRAGWIRIEVRDPSRGLPCLMPQSETALQGRGLYLVNQLSDRWGVDLLPRGKATWFEMRVTTGDG
ncbi:ATP-binding protein [Streptomyces phaeochromogenes]|uniref:ATP-binding protein n=1 Tax=Streptomyces phaeochromogenes TaxID=1923 RepID=A0ABZ1H0S2_STRPH|nr:ATP-binding protein [Streptomyces phaeochromogenes]WSD11859.1 ATP-binding protein [Streptomyces phaeochromogenes]